MKKSLGLAPVMSGAELIRRAIFGDADYEALVASGTFDAVLKAAPEEEAVRKEFGKDADVKYQLERFGVDLTRRPIPGAVVDYDMDRLSALQLLGEAEALFESLPPVVREKYKTWPEIEAAALNGELTKLFEEKKEAPPADVPPV